VQQPAGCVKNSKCGYKSTVGARAPKTCNLYFAAFEPLVDLSARCTSQFRVVRRGHHGTKAGSQDPCLQLYLALAHKAHRAGTETDSPEVAMLEHDTTRQRYRVDIEKPREMGSTKQEVSTRVIVQHSLADEVRNNTEILFTATIVRLLWFAGIGAKMSAQFVHTVGCRPPPALEQTSRLSQENGYRVFEDQFAHSLLTAYRREWNVGRAQNSNAVRNN
jgi:hypothetical protein